LYFHIRSDNKKLSWQNSPLLVLLEFIDPYVLPGNEEMRPTPLRHVADLADPFDYSTQENQLNEGGANVNAVCIPEGETPLHKACYSAVLTNLDFVELLLEVDADPNAQDHRRLIPSADTLGAAKFLLNWLTTDVSITTRSGASFLARARSLITD
jgi:ankyrin repeat protein